MAALALTSVLLQSPMFLQNLLPLTADAWMPDHTAIRTFNIAALFSSEMNGAYQPVSGLILALLLKASGGNALIFHVCRWVLHIINAFQVKAIGDRLGYRQAAWTSAFLFAAFPFWLGNTAHVTQAFFLLFALSYLRLTFTNNSRSSLSAHFVLLLALLSHPVALTLPLIAVAGKNLSHEKIYVRKLLPHLILAAVYFLFLFIPEADRDPFTDAGQAGFGARITGNLTVLHFFAWPTAHHILANPVLWPNPLLTVLFTSLLIILSAVFVWLRPSYGKNVLFAWTGCLLASSAGTWIEVRSGDFMAFHPPYLALAFLFFLTGWMTAEIMKNRSLYLALPLAGLWLFSAWNSLPSEKSGIGYWNNMAVLHPKSKTVLHQRAAFLIGENKFEQALDDIEKLIDLGQPSPHTIAKKAYCLFNLQYYERSLALLDSLIAAEPAFGQAWAYRGMAKARFELGREAIPDYQQAIRLGYETGELYNSFGITVAMLGQVTDAIMLFDHAIEKDPFLASAYGNRANARSKTGDLQGALQDFNIAIALEPESIKSLYGRGVLRNEKFNDFAGAMQDFNRILMLDPRNGGAFMGRATARLQLGDVAGACQDFREAARFNVFGAREHLEQICGQ